MNCFRLATAVVILAFASGCDRKSPPKQDVVKLVDRGLLTNAPVYIAEEEGYFADEGIRLQFSEPPRSSSQVIPLMERGDVDVMTSALSSGFYAAVAKGARSRIVADRGHVAASGCDFDGVMARRGLFDKGSPTATDLRGKRFSLGATGSAAYITDKYLESIGLTTADLDIVRLSETLEAQALDAGSIDGMHVAEPYLSRLVAEGHKLIGPARLYAPGAHYAVVIYGPSLTVARRDLGRRFMRAYLRGVKKFQEGLTPRSAEILARRTGMSPDAIRKVCLPTIDPGGELNFPSLLDFQKWAVRHGYLSAVLGAEDGTDMTFARQAAKELGITATVK
jgi:NitT/TauT family transport system substrate-binding protein